MRDDELLGKLREIYSAPDIDPSSFDVRDMIYAFGSPLTAIMYSRLFWPEFVEIDGMVFMEGTIEDEGDRRQLTLAFERCGKDRSLTERSFNLVEVPAHLFGRNAGETTEAEDFWFAQRLRDMWDARLKTLYPERRFVVEVLTPETTGGEVGIIFYQK